MTLSILILRFTPVAPLSIVFFFAANTLTAVFGATVLCVARVLVVRPSSVLPLRGSESEIASESGSCETVSELANVFGKS